jgi:hypothetical protein
MTRHSPQSFRFLLVIDNMQYTSLGHGRKSLIASAMLTATGLYGVR